MREPNLSTGTPVPVVRVSRGTESDFQLSLLRQCRMTAGTVMKAIVSLAMLHQALDFLVKFRGRNSDASLESFSDFG